MPTIPQRKFAAAGVASVITGVPRQGLYELVERRELEAVKTVRGRILFNVGAYVEKKLAEGYLLMALDSSERSDARAAATAAMKARVSKASSDLDPLH